MKVIFTVKDAHKEIGGFMTIGKAYSKTWDWQRFWAFTAFLKYCIGNHEHFTYSRIGWRTRNVFII